MSNIIVHPVLTEETAPFFISPYIWEPWTNTYGKDDVLERENHLENYLRLRDISNLKNLCGTKDSLILSPVCEVDIKDFSLAELLVKISIGTESDIFNIKIPKIPTNALKPSQAHSRWHQLDISGVAKFSDICNDRLSSAEFRFEEVLGGSDWQLKWEVRLYFCRDTQWVSIDPKVVLVRDGIDVVPDVKTVGEEIINNTVMTYVTGSDDEAEVVGYKLNIPLHCYNFALE